MNIFQRFFYYLRLRRAVALADEAYLSTGTRHYVMPGSGPRCELLVMDRRNFRKLKQKGYISDRALVADMVKESFYFTPHRNGDGYLSETDRRRKMRQYFSWIEAQRMASKERRHGRRNK